MRTIDADILKVVLEKNFGHTGGASVLEQLIDEQPTVQPNLQPTCNQLATDTISRKAAIDAIYHHFPSVSRTRARTMLHEVPSVQPDIIRCRNCKFASGDSRICMKFDHSPIGELDFCSFAERREVNNESD